MIFYISIYNPYKKNMDKYDKSVNIRNVDMDIKFVNGKDTDIFV